VDGDPGEDRVRSSFRTWLTEHWDPALTVRQWWALLAASGWGFPSWPEEWFGRGLGARSARAVGEEMIRAGVLGPPAGAGTSMGAPILFTHGSDEQRRRWLPALARGEECWGQLFSEPDAGSDLASLTTRAVRAGDEWVVHGQKVWNSGTLASDRALLLARTDPSLPRHRGLGFFVVDIHQPGVEVRPIRQMNGRAEFNETFLTGARVHDTARIGPPTGGWSVAMSTLTHERSLFAGGGDVALTRVRGGTRAGVLDRRVDDVLADRSVHTDAGNVLPIGTIPALIELARRCGRLDDALIRQRLAALHARSEALRWTSLRGQAASAAGRVGAEGSIAYLGGVGVVRSYRDLVAAIAGAGGLLDGTDVAGTILTAPAHGIQGGTEQIQRNLLGERILGLPREPRLDEPDRARTP